MAIGRVNTGGTNLSIKFVGGTTQPTGKEGLSWLDTSTELGTIYINDAPISPVEGDVHIITSQTGSATIVVLSTDGILLPIHPISATQYIGGSWVTLSAKTFHNGVWTDWIPYLYLDGNEFISATGGWVNTGYTLPNGYSQVTSTKNDNNLYMATTSNNKISMFGTNIQIDFANYTELHIQYNGSSSGQYAGLSLVLSTAKKFGSSVVALTIPNGDYTDYIVPVNSIDSSLYLFLYVSHASASLTVTKIWLS